MAIVEIDSYELYHIGSKLNPAINYDKMGEDLKTNLKHLGFKIIDDKVKTNLRTEPSEVIAVKSNVKLEMNYATEALNVIGTQPSEVTSVFEELMGTLSKMEYDIESTIIFFEILASVILKSKDKPVEKIGMSIGLDSNLFADNNVPLVNTIGLRIGGNKPSDKTSIILTIEPSPVNPTLKTSVTVQYRAEKDNIIKFHELFEANIIKLLEKVLLENVSC